MATAPRDFHHPFDPYTIQVEFMTNLYDCLQKRQVGIFESPTVTDGFTKGKSLSIICGALTWLKEHQKEQMEGGQFDKDDDEPEWVIEYARQERIQRAIAAKRDLESRLAKVRAEERLKRQRYERGEPPRKRPRGSDKVSDPEVAEAEFLLNDYESDGEDHLPQAAGRSDNALSAETQKLLEKAGMAIKPNTEDDDVLSVATKVFFCSRTHSQLSQFASEVKRVRIPLEDADGDEGDSSDQQHDTVRLVPLASRRNLCINPKVVSLRSATAINEKCLELQQSKTPKEQKCQFIPDKDNEPLLHQFRDLTMAQIRDVEDLGKIGKESGICPYYASRAAVAPSEIVTLPYPLLLQRSAREALDISLKDQIVVIDEAHNLMDSIEGIHSSAVSLHQLQQARLQLTGYLHKFRNKLKGKNRVYVAQVVRLIDSLSSYLVGKQTGSSKGGTVAMTELISGKGLDQVNLHKLCHYLQESKLARKVAGYTAHALKQTDNPNEGSTGQSDIPVLMGVEAFFHALTNPTDEGQFFYEYEDNGILLKYMLLDPAHHFRDIVDEARAVVLAGGTMSPMEDYMTHLFPYLSSDRIRTLSCGHVIPKENLLAYPLTSSSGTSLEFTFEKRSSPHLMTEVGRCITLLAQRIPDGLVVFFPSYQYLELMVKHWSNTRDASSGMIIDNMKSIKPIFQEHKGVNVDKLLGDYATSISSNNGGLMLSVIGGKLSEGINFSDRLGRGVVVVGLPFPNSQSIQWKAKLDYIERSTVERGGTLASGKVVAREYYENACMRAVNQSVGRAIRHRGDYACIVLLDRRYSSKRIQAKLPGWIKDGLVNGNDGGLQELLPRVAKFFDGHITQNQLIRQ